MQPPQTLVSQVEQVAGLVTQTILAQAAGKFAYQFKCIDGKGGTVRFPETVDAATALIECRLSLGPKVISVY